MEELKKELREERQQFSRTYDMGLEIAHRHCRDPITGEWVTTDIKAVAPPLNDTTNAHGGDYTHYYPKATTPIEIDQVTGAMRMIFDGGESICLGGTPGLDGEFMGGVTPTISKSFPDYDVKYTASTNSLKRWWRLKKAPRENIRTFTSPIKCINCSVVDNKVISETGKILAKFSTAFCYEESNKWNPFTRDGEHKPVEMQATSTCISVTIDTTGMSFPVIIDPTLSLITSTKFGIIFPLSVVSETGVILNEGALYSICALLNDDLRLEIGEKDIELKTGIINQAEWDIWHKDFSLKVFMVADHVNLAKTVAVSKDSYWSKQDISAINNIKVIEI